MTDRNPIARRARAASSASVALAALFLALVPAGCDDPGCVFGGNCFDSGGPGAGLGANPASIPQDGATILPGAPTVVDHFPEGVDADSQTPIVIVFSEAMSQQNLNIAFRLVGTGIASGDVPTASALVGDGRVLVMLPITQLQPSVLYEIRYRDNVNFQDLTGQAVVQPTNTLIGTFTTAAEDGIAPKVLATWPPDGATQASPTNEIVVVFDRAISASTVTHSSWVVTVDDVVPAVDPAPQPVTVGTTFTSDTRVWRYRPVDAQDALVPFGTGVEVELVLSPPGNAIQDTENTNLLETSISFTTSPFSAPTAATITSSPSDAIGIDQIVGPENLAVRVDLLDAIAGDVLEIYLFGTKQDEPNPENAPLAALLREVPLDNPAGSVTLTADELGLRLSDDPLKGVFADGEVAFAFQIRRGAQRSPLKLLDVDAVEEGPQHPVLDTVRPVLVGLSTTGGIVTSFSSDVRDVVLVGRASEPIRAALVETPLGANTPTPAVPPPVAGADDDSELGTAAEETAGDLFVAAPVALGIVPPAAQPLDYDLTIYDRAFNTAATPTFSGAFTQLGASGPGTALPGGSIAVRVYDASTLSPLVGARVTTHANVGGVVAFVDSLTTDPAGAVAVLAAAAGETILTVEATGYGLFTFDGVPTDRLDVPLQPESLVDASASGLVATTNPELNLYTRNVSDSRSRETATKLFPVALCTPDTVDQRLECPFNGILIRPRQIGVQTAVAYQIPSNPFLYSALTFLKAFELEFPVRQAVGGGAVSNVLELPFLLDDGGLDPEERPIDFPAHVLSSAAYPSLAVSPRISVETTSPGVRGPVVVGAGVAFQDTSVPDAFAVRAAYPGAVDGVQEVPEDLLGRLVSAQTVDGDLRLRAELVDTDGNVAGARPRLSQTNMVLVPPAPSTIDPVVPALPNPGGVSFDLFYSDVLPDSVGEPGIYRVLVTDSAGRRWTIWRTDRPDADGGGVVHVPFVGPGNTLPLAAGTLRAQISTFAWPGFDPASFLWSDVEREHDLYSHAIRAPFTAP